MRYINYINIIIKNNLSAWYRKNIYFVIISNNNNKNIQHLGVYLCLFA